jgi:tetratricopeptide (TPR) repeat protein
MRGNKDLLADVLFNFKTGNLFNRLPMRNRLIILSYHRIRPSDPQFQSEFDDGVFNVDEDEFARQIKWLKHSTRILSENDLIDIFSSSCPRAHTSMPSVVITFDVGYKDNYTRAFPILKRFDVPAIIFVATQMINSRLLAWWDIIAYLIKHCTRPFITFDKQKFLIPNQINDAIMFFQQLMKHEPSNQTKYLLSELSEACEVALPEPSLQDREILSWDEIREMAQNKIGIGSHTHTLSVLSTISPGAQKEEMILSKLIIEKNIGRQVLTISYPVGESRFITAETFSIAAASGYALGFTTNTGINDLKYYQPYGVKRIARLLEKVSTISLLSILPGLFTWDSAADFQIKLMESHPTYADAYFRLGIIHLGQGKIDQAIANFQEAVRFNPNYIEARIKLGISQTFAGLYGDAEKNLKMILDKRPSFADIHYYLGIVYASNRQIPLAIQSLEKAVQIKPSYKDAILKLGILYYHQTQYGKSLSMLERASELDCDPDLKSLIEAWQSIIAIHGQESSDFNPLYTYYIGSNGHIDELIAGFATHLCISPNLNEIMAIVEKGDFPMENLEALLSLFQEYESTFPEYADIRYMQGVLYRKLDDFSAAERCFNESLRLNPNYVKARMNLFNILRENKRYAEALEHGHILERYSLPYPDLYCGLAETLSGLNQHSDARQYALKAISINPAYPMAQQVLQQIAGNTE